MKKSIFLVVSMLSLLTIASCSESTSYRHIYLSGKYKLTYAAINTTYSLSDEPAYASFISNSVNVLDNFDTSKSFYELNVKIENNKPVGYGSVEIFTLNDSYTSDFEYICYYNGVYGGTIYQTEESNISFLGGQVCRGNTFGFVRTEAYLPNISDDRLILEFTLVSDYEDLDFFNHSIF